MKRNWQLFIIFIVIVSMLGVCIYFGNSVENDYEIQQTVKCFNSVDTVITGTMTGVGFRNFETFEQQEYVGSFRKVITICFDKKIYLPVIMK